MDTHITLLVIELCTLLSTPRHLVRSWFDPRSILVRSAFARSESVTRSITEAARRAKQRTDVWSKRKIAVITRLGSLHADSRGLPPDFRAFSNHLQRRDGSRCPQRVERWRSARRLVKGRTIEASAANVARLIFLRGVGSHVLLFLSPRPTPRWSSSLETVLDLDLRQSKEGEEGETRDWGSE